jgi:hypothetical protein
LEYQGETHFFSSNIFGKSSDRQRADQIKRNFASQMGITLISIPFWWDKSPNSLASTIRLYRPDINISGISVAEPIPSTIPKQLLRLNRTPSAPKEWTDEIDPTGW